MFSTFETPIIKRTLPFFSIVFLRHATDDDDDPLAVCIDFPTDPIRFLKNRNQVKERRGG